MPHAHLEPVRPTEGGGSDCSSNPLKQQSKIVLPRVELGAALPVCRKKGNKGTELFFAFSQQLWGGSDEHGRLVSQHQQKEYLQPLLKPAVCIYPAATIQLSPPPFPSPPKTRKKSGQIISQRCARPTRSHELFEPLNHHAQKKGRSAQGTGVHSIRHWRGMVVNMFCDSARARVLANKG